MDDIDKIKSCVESVILIAIILCFALIIAAAIANGALE